jgi:hypothetical protein
MSGALDRRVAVRLTSVADVPLAVAETLLERAHGRIGPLGYAVRAAAFLISTRTRLLPERARRHGVGALLTLALPGPGELLLYLGMADTPDTTACAGLLPR